MGKKLFLVKSIMDITVNICVKVLLLTTVEKRITKHSHRYTYLGI